MLNSTIASSSAGRPELSWRPREKYPNKDRYVGVALFLDYSVSLIDAIVLGRGVYSSFEPSLSVPFFFQSCKIKFGTEVWV